MKPITRFFFTFLFGISLSILAILLARGQTVVAAPQVTIRYVATTGSDTTDCTHSATPCATIQYAVDQAGAGDEVRVAGGEYTDVHVRVEHDPFPPNQTLFQTVFISQPLTLRGGYTLTNWTTSDPLANPTTLNPQGEGRGVVVMTTQGVTIENFRVIGGDATIDDYLFSEGGGIGLFYSEAEVNDCYIAGNEGHGGIGVDSSTATLYGNTITGHLSSGVYGGYSTITMTENTVSGNVGQNGGGIYIQESDVYLKANTVMSNSVDNIGGGIYVYNGNHAVLLGNTITGNTADNNSGGLLLINNGSILIDGNSFIGNSALTDVGGGVFLGGAEATFSNNLVQDNQAPYEGGGVYVNGGTFYITNNEIRGNSSGWDGGGMTILAAQAIIEGNSIVENSAEAIGGGIMMLMNGQGVTITNNLISDNQIVGSGFLWDGSGIYLQGNEATLSHNTIAHNYGGDGSGILLEDNDTTATMIDNIIVSHTLGLRAVNGATVSTEATLWGNETNWDTSFGGTITTGTINLYGDPAFLDPANGDYHLSPTSLAIDAGIDAGIPTDIDGDPRPHGLGFDIGADEQPVVVRYVATTGSDTTDCTHSATPCATIQYAVDQAGAGDEVRVAGGEYTDVHTRPRNDIQTTGFVEQIVYLTKTVTIRGGYTLANWTFSNPVANPTTLDAQSQGRGVYITGAIAPTLQGLRIVRGSADGQGGVNTRDLGGGLYAYQANLTLLDSQLISNTITNPLSNGGAIALNGGSANIVGNSLQFNSAGFGGAIFTIFADVTLIQNQVISNTSESTSGVAISLGTTQILSNTFTGNQTTNHLDSALGLFEASGNLQHNLFTNNDAAGLYIAGTVNGINTVNLHHNEFFHNVTQNYGGAISASYLEALTMTQNLVISNTATGGGGVYLLHVHVNMGANQIANNHAGMGGGMYIQNSDAILTEEAFLNNTSNSAVGGGGLIASDSIMNISNSLFDGNRTAQTTGSNGGAIYLSDSTGMLQNNTFMNNMAKGGGAIYLQEGTATLENNQIAMNTATFGGGILSEHCNITLQANEIISNTASRGGGLSFTANSFTNRQVSMTGNLIAHNFATQWGGGICIDAEVVFTSTNDLIVDNQAGSYGSGVFMGLFGGGETRFVNSTIAHNTGGYGIGLINVGSQVWLTNTILVSHTIGIWIDSPGVAHTEAMLWGNEMNVVLTNTTITTGTINLYGDPHFVDPINGDYHLSPDSIAIDAGIDSGVPTDLDGDTRPQGAGFDIGADEFVSVFAPSGLVQLQGRDDASGAVVTAWNGGTLVATTTTDSSGAYMLTLPDGTYTLTVEMPLYLDARKTNVTISNSSPFSLTPVTLKGGDVNESDTINILDLVVIGAHYNLTCGDPDWDPRADINGDCEVNLLDLVFAAGNFGKSSPVGW